MPKKTHQKCREATPFRLLSEKRKPYKIWLIFFDLYGITKGATARLVYKEVVFN